MKASRFTSCQEGSKLSQQSSTSNNFHQHHARSIFVPKGRYRKMPHKFQSLWRSREEEFARIPFLLCTWWYKGESIRKYPKVSPVKIPLWLCAWCLPHTAQVTKCVDWEESSISILPSNLKWPTFLLSRNLYEILSLLRHHTHRREHSWDENGKIDENNSG